MKAIYKGQVYSVVEDLGQGLLLEPLQGGVNITAAYGDADLTVDPTDGELAEADYLTEDYKDTQEIKNRVDWKKLGKMPAPFNEPQLPTYPARPMQGGPLEQALEAGLCTAPDTGERWAFEPKVNGWRALVHTPTGSMWNRHGKRMVPVTEIRPAVESLKTCPFEWLDVEILERRHNIAQGSLIVLDWVVTNATYNDRQALLAAIFPRFKPGFETEYAPVQLITSVQLGLDVPATLRFIWNQLQNINSILGATFYEGLVAKRRASTYPMQMRSPEEVTSDWIKHRFTNHA